eukprot:scaffold28034_cov194-Skeletonema_dohrnii-CCMP3373.AAC.1
MQQRQWLDSHPIVVLGFRVLFAVTWYGARVAAAGSWQSSQVGPHQVTYDVVATPIRPKNA